MKKLIAIILLFTSVQAFCIWHTGAHDQGLIWLKIANYGMFARGRGSEDHDYCIWPKSSGESYIYGAGIWVGGVVGTQDTSSLKNAIDDTMTVIPVSSTALFDSIGVFKIEDELIHYRGKQDTLFLNCMRGFAGTNKKLHPGGLKIERKLLYVTVGYDPSSATTEFVPGNLPNEPDYSDPFDRIYFSDNPEDTALWPIRDEYGNPVVTSSQDSYAEFNDFDSTRSVHPLGIKVVQIGYSWYYCLYEDFIFLTCKIINLSPDTLFNTYLAVCCDADIGDYTDDLIGFDKVRDLGYAYDSDFYESGWSHIPGYIGFDFLESPLDTSSEQLGLRAFKITHNPSVSGEGEEDPSNDDEAYQLIAGYNYSTGEYSPFDSISNPTDVRFLQCTGPFNLPPGDTGKIVIAVIAGADLPDLEQNSDLAQTLYDVNFITHKVTLLSPNGDEETQGIYNITWEDSSVTGAPLKVDIACSRDNGSSWQNIAIGLSDPHFYNWDTSLFPDGTRYRVRVTVHDTLAIGEDWSDTTFTINNPGNGVPDLLFLSPNEGELSDTILIKWWAKDADHDTLHIDILHTQNGEDWNFIAQNEENDGVYEWNTHRVNNGNCRLLIITYDSDTFTTDTAKGWIHILNDHRVLNTPDHIVGGCNTLSILVLEYEEANLTNHTYEIRFNPIKDGGGKALYTYNLLDLSASGGLDSLLLTDSLFSTQDGNLYIHYSQIIDGFALQFDLQIDKKSFKFINFKQLANVSGFDGKLETHHADTHGIASPVFYWPFRGSDYEVRWIYSEDTTKLTLEIYDLANNVFVPFDSTIGDNWFLGKLSNPSQFFDPAEHRDFYLCGTYFWFNKHYEMTNPPGPGDIWKIESAGHRTPCDGNVYIFYPLGVEEIKLPGQPILFQNYPNPFNETTVISVKCQVPNASLKIYDLAGRLVKSFQLNTNHLPLTAAVSWDGKDRFGKQVPSGIYFYRLSTKGVSASGREVNNFSNTKKLILIR
ncbi:T9SS type A sorting domain-containing protein [candidate division WOR-3 bacterium]|nr:T9SS type A sorting domain-containing protein [candidate division WOR-3 bacterium]